MLFKSRKEIAKQFKKWVCEVIKEIRLNGNYQLKKQIEEKNLLIEEQQKIITEKELGL
jgi:prophage antirepressor-like protein